MPLKIPCGSEQKEYIKGTRRDFKKTLMYLELQNLGVQCVQDPKELHDLFSSSYSITGSYSINVIGHKWLAYSV